MLGDSQLPLLLFLLLLGLFLPAVIVLRRREATIAILPRCAVGVAILVPLMFAVMACAYATSASFFDHFEASIALGALRILAGEQAFSDPAGAAQYASIYGPNAYLFNALWVAVWPEVIAGSKLAGASAALAFCAVFTLACVRKNGWAVAALQLAMTVGGCMLFEHLGYWNRCEPLQLLGVALTITALTLSSTLWMAVALGAGVALLVNLKVHSLLYAMPVIAELMFRRQWRVLFGGALLAAAGLTAPFLQPDLFSLRNYLLALTGATHHALSSELFLGNLCALLFFSLPLVTLGLRNRKVIQPATDGVSSACLVTLGCVSLLVCGIGSKLGAGPHHLLPLLPHFAWIMGGPFQSFVRSGTVRPFPVAATSAWIISLLSCIWTSQGLVCTRIQHDGGLAVIEDLHSIRATYPRYSIQMGCGTSHQWPLYWFRPELRSRNPVDFLDVTAWMDMHYAGRTIPAPTINTFTGEVFDMWLIPRSGTPFTQKSYYPPFRDLFSHEFREAFAKGYQLAGRSAYFDIYLARRLVRLPNASDNKVSDASGNGARVSTPAKDL